MTQGNGYGGPVLPAGGGRNASDRHLRDYINAIRRRWWIVVLVAAAVVGGSIWRQRGQVPQYRAMAQVQRSSYAGDFLTGGYAAWMANDPAQLATQVQIIRTRSVVEPVVDSLGLRLVVDDPNWRRSAVIESAWVDTLAQAGSYLLEAAGGQVRLVNPATGATVSSAPRDGVLAGPGFAIDLTNGFMPVAPVELQVLAMDAAVDRVRGGLDPFMDRASVLINIQYTSPDPILAARVAQQVAEQYRWHAGGERRRKAAETVAVLNAEMRGVEAQIDSAARGGVPSNTPVNAEYEQVTQMVQQVQNRAHEFESTAAVLQRALDEYEETGRLTALTALGALVPAINTLYERYQGEQVVRNRALPQEGASGKTVLAADSSLDQIRSTMEQQTRSTLAVTIQQGQAERARVLQLQAQQRGLMPGMADAADVNREVQSLQDQWRRLVDSRLSAQVEASVESSPVEIVQPAVVPTSPIPQNRERTLILALVAGLALGVIAALLLEQLDTRVRDPEDVQRSAGMGVIGLIPSLRYKEGGRPLPLSRVEEQTMGTEAFRKLRTNLRFVRAERPQLIAVTSASPSEGKSVLSANLALALVQQRTRVLLIDADLRRPVQHSIFGLKRDPGLSDVLVGILPPTQAIRKDVEVPGLYVMPCGTEPPNPSELLGSKEFEKLLVQMRKHFDTVIVDTPPVHLVSDAAVVSTVVDGVLVVVDAGRTDRNVLAGAVNELRQARANLLGVVLNRVDSSGGYGFGYGYGRYGRYKKSAYYRKPAAAGESEWKETLDSFWKQVSPYV